MKDLLLNESVAELLLLQEIFHEELRKRRNKYGYKSPKMWEDMMVRLVTHLMNYFCTLYKVIIRRFIEVGKKQKQTGWIIYMGNSGWTIGQKR